jgi:hypothetical protein
MEKYLPVSSVDELDQDLANLVLEMTALQAMVHKMRATSTAFDNVIIFPSIDMDSRYKKVKLEIQFFEGKMITLSKAVLVARILWTIACKAVISSTKFARS